MEFPNRQRFLDIAHFKKTGDLCLLTPTFNEFWPETLNVWAKHGGPARIQNARFRGEYFQFFHFRETHEIAMGLIAGDIDIKGTSYHYLIPPICPTFEPKIISEDEHTVTILNEGGQKARVFKNQPEKMPMYLEQPVKDRQSWNEYKKRLQPDTPGRFPADWATYARKLNEKDEPVMMFTGSFFGFLREFLGVEKLLYSFYDDPAWVEDMMEHICEMELTCVKKVLKDIRVDFVYFWEDMAFKTGPLISPAMFKKYMVPRYRRITDLLRKNGIDVIFVDSDGNIDELIPLWLEGGVNAFWPLECAAGMNAVELRKKYGKDIIMSGNMDKRALIRGKNDIKQEVMSKVPFLLEKGGYFPSVDHGVPPDVPFENYEYFINLLREVAGLPKLSN
ncbi:MAG: uroporphyrinogen decarboxylase family protein [Dehalococcoidales bacterium]|nr:uroporphyrinogen decarboxylase family protein [Dehalococcoidales bacterium]